MTKTSHMKEEGGRINRFVPEDYVEMFLYVCTVRGYLFFKSTNFMSGAREKVQVSTPQFLLILLKMSWKA